MNRMPVTLSSPIPTVVLLPVLLSPLLPVSPNWFNAPAYGQSAKEQATGPGPGRPVGIFANRAQYNDFMGAVKQAAYDGPGNPELQAMVPMLNDIVLNQPIGTTSQKHQISGSGFGLLLDPQIRSDLELLDQQQKELASLGEKIQRRAAQQLKQTDILAPEQLANQMRLIRQQATKDLETVLLPHQLERLQQIRAQAVFSGKSIAQALATGPLKDQLEISDQQASELEKAEQEIESELNQKIAELRRHARQRLLSKLDRTQRKKLDDLFGDLVDPPETRNLRSGAAKSKGKNLTGKKR